MGTGFRCALVAVLLGGACGTPPPPAAGAEDAVAAAPPREGLALRTDAGEYTLKHRPPFWDTRIPVSFRNPLPDTVYMVNCREEVAMTLEKKTAQGWVPFWEPILDLCLSPPVRIAPGAAYADTVWVGGAMPGMNSAPAFASRDLDGVYRLRWDNVVLHYREFSAGSPNWGDSIPAVHRTSNEFVLRMGR
jgi:hypothetical protein